MDFREHVEAGSTACLLERVEVAVPRALFAVILGRIGRRREAPSPG